MELIPLLVMRDLFLHMKGSLYASCVTSVTLYSCEIWNFKDNNVRRLECADKSMVRGEEMAMASLSI